VGRAGTKSTPRKFGRSAAAFIASLMHCVTVFSVCGGGGLNTASVVSEIKSIHVEYCVRSERCDWPCSDMFRHVEGCI
jgi:hypothetical protein